MFLTTPLALWLFPAAVLAFLLLQIFQARRGEILAGSLMLWRRVAGALRAPTPRRLVYDRSFWLQLGALLALTLALAGPGLGLRTPPGRRLVLVLDNGPATRIRVGPQRQALWLELAASARAMLEALAPEDRVVLLSSAPQIQAWGTPGDPLDNGLPASGLTPGQALERLGDLRPCLSSVDTQQVWSAALQAAHAFPRGESEPAPRVLAFSARPAPAGAQEAAGAWQVVAPATPPANVGLLALGAEWVETQGGAEPGAEVLVQVRNFSTAPAPGRVVLEALGEEPGRVSQEVPLLLGPCSPQRREEGVSAGAAFQLGRLPAALRIRWQAAHDASGVLGDALPEDDSLLALRRSATVPTLRFHGQAPHLQRLLQSGRGATVLTEESQEAALLSVYVDRIPGTIPEQTAAVLFLAPTQACEAFEVLPGTLKRPRPVLGEPDRLTRGFAQGEQGLGFRIAESRCLKGVGDLRVLLRDEAGNLLAARFRLADGRPGFVFGFVPGEGELGGGFEFDEVLGGIFLRILREAEGARAPYEVARAADWERKNGQGLALDWSPGKSGPGASEPGGVLDLEVSRLNLGTPAGQAGEPSRLLPSQEGVPQPLGRYFALLALALVALELWLERREGGT